MKIVNIEKQKAVVIGYFKIIEKFSIDEAIKNFISNFKNNTIRLCY